MDTLKLGKNKYAEKIRSLILLGLTCLFPLNQQLHLKPFPSVDGFIIDYLIVKISLPELLLVLLTVLQIGAIREFLRNSILTRYTSTGFLILSVLTTIFSNYKLLSIYENLIILLLILNLGVFLKYSKDLKLDLFVKSVKFWLILLSILGFFQFFLQKSVLNNYALFGEFPYSEDYYHVKQKGFLFEDLIPPYAIFSHSNIFGGFVLLAIMFLGISKKDSFYFHTLTVVLLLIIGSLNIFLCYLLWVVLTKLPKLKNLYVSFSKTVFLLFIIYFLQLFLSLNYFSYSGNFSLYRRLYMFDLSINLLVENPKYLFFSGYYNYFGIAKESLYIYEIVRFFQPPHNLFNLLIWQYGVVFLVSFLVLLNKAFQKIPQDLVKFLSVILVASMFDHFFLTNHQLKFFVFLIIPYSLIAKNSIK